MKDSERLVESNQLRLVGQHATAQLGLLYDPKLVQRMVSYIITQVRRGEVSDGITHASLIRGSRVPSWVAHRGMLGHVLTLVALESYKRDGVLLTALVRSRADDDLPTPGFCAFLEDVGLVMSADAREECLELWDHHWKLVISLYDTAQVNPGGIRDL